MNKPDKNGGSNIAIKTTLLAGLFSILAALIGAFAPIFYAPSTSNPSQEKKEKSTQPLTAREPAGQQSSNALDGDVTSEPPSITHTPKVTPPRPKDNTNRSAMKIENDRQYTFLNKQLTIGVMFHTVDGLDLVTLIINDASGATRRVPMQGIGERVEWVLGQETYNVHMQKIDWAQKHVLISINKINQ